MFRCGISEEGDDIFHPAEGNEIAKRFLARKKRDRFSAVFSDIGAEEFLGLKTGG
jgi:hypothetical protein